MENKFDPLGPRWTETYTPEAETQTDMLRNVLRVYCGVGNCHFWAATYDLTCSEVGTNPLWAAAEGHLSHWRSQTPKKA